MSSIVSCGDSSSMIRPTDRPSSRWACNLAQDRALARAGARGPQRDLAAALADEELGEAVPRVGADRVHSDLVTVDRAHEDLVRAEGSRLEDGADHSLALALHETLVGVLQGELCDLRLARGQDLATFLAAFCPASSMSNIRMTSL